MGRTGVMGDGWNHKYVLEEAQRRQETDDPLLRDLLSEMRNLNMGGNAGGDLKHDHEAAGGNFKDDHESVGGQDFQEPEYPSPTSSSIKVDDLLKPKTHTMTLLKGGRVFALENGRYARISIKDFQLFVHSLKSDLQILLLHSVILPMNDIVPQTPPCRVFLDLQWPNNGHRGRVIIHLFSNCSLSQQFLLLCTGQRGLSYVDTPLLGVWKKGKEGERVLGGIHIGNEEREIAQLPKLNGNNTSKPYWKGDVLARKTSGSLNAQFAISTRDLSSPAKSGNVFGKVEFGLDILQNAAKCDTVTHIRIVDCGVVIPIRT
ncbi:hypothetical protein O3P69_003415 [Scylla paramamosain]|uniref:Uncharacterized protein n=1 Tax=Scylla paramamosain TaxID=85552 RepID=A0AAW0UHU9_SCYPA